MNTSTIVNAAISRIDEDLELVKKAVVKRFRCRANCPPHFREHSIAVDHAIWREVGSTELDALWIVVGMEVSLYLIQNRATLQWHAVNYDHATVTFWTVDTQRVDPVESKGPMLCFASSIAYNSILEAVKKTPDKCWRSSILRIRLQDF